MRTTPLEFINSTRIEEACKQLKSTDHSILSISEQVGFHSISSFNRCFSKLMGQSPKRGAKVHKPKYSPPKHPYWSLPAGSRSRLERRENKLPPPYGGHSVSATNNATMNGCVMLILYLTQFHLCLRRLMPSRVFYGRYRQPQIPSKGTALIFGTE